MRSYCFVTALFLAVLSLASCESSSTDSTPNNALTPPGVGSVFSYYGYYVDAAGVKIDSTAWYDTVTVIATGIIYDGKNNVLQAKPGYQLPGSFWNYESNGDVSIHIDNHISGSGEHSGWLTIPLASKGNASFTSLDTVRNGTEIKFIESYTYTGDETITEAGHTFNTSTFIRENIYADGSSHNRVTEWYDRATGRFIKGDGPRQGAYSIWDWGGGKVDLIGYTLK